MLKDSHYQCTITLSRSDECAMAVVHFFIKFAFFSLFLFGSVVF